MKATLFGFSIVVLEALIFTSTVSAQTSRIPPTPHDHALESVSPVKHLLLPFGISVDLPAGWRVENEIAVKALAASRTDNVDLRFLIPANDLPRNNHLLIIACPLSYLPEEASFEIGVSDARVGQSEVAALSAAELESMSQSDEHEYRSVLAHVGRRMARWDGTSRVRFGGMLALVSHYESVGASDKHLLTDSYRVFRRQHSVFIRVFHSPEMNSALAAQLESVEQTFQIR